MTVNKLGPLQWNTPIVDSNGKPTREFQEKWKDQFGINNTIPDLSTAAKVSLVIDLLGAARGDILVRGVNQWAGLASPSDASKFLSGAADPVWAAVLDSDVAFSDIATGNVSTLKHGYAPKAPNDATKYLDGTGAYSVPAGGSGVGESWQAPTTGTLSTTAHATKGHFLIPLTDISISKVWVRFGPVTSSVYRVQIWSLSTLTLVAALHTPVALPWTSTGDQGIVVALPSTVTLTAGLRYAILVTRTDSTSTAVCAIPSAAGSAFSSPINQTLYGFVSTDTVAPSAGAVLSSPSSTYIPVGHNIVGDGGGGGSFDLGDALAPIWMGL